MRIWILAIVAAVVVVGLVVAGVLSRQDVEGAARKAASDTKTLVQEATGGYHGEVPNSVAVAMKCRETMKQIEAAKREVAQKKSQTVGAVSWDEVLAYMRLTQRPTCPAGGTYSLNTLQHVVTCSVGGNQTSTTEDDHSIQNW